MSGDVQPRKRKDKKKKRDDEASHGVHVTKMGSDDVLLHVHEEHGTGGHWCAKIIFFSLMAILMGLVCLIILENRGLSDVDTPLSESRFSNYFDGWVDEHRDDHDDHHDSHGSLEHDDHEADEEHDDEDEDDHDEPFEEEADHSEGDDAEAAEEEDENVTPEEDEEEDGDNITAENVTAEEDDDEEEDDEVVTAEIDDNVTAEEADDENVTGEDEVTKEQNEDDNDIDEEDEEADDDDDNATKETSKPASQAAPDDDDDDPFDEDDDDGTFDSLEKIVDNDAAELELLKEKARQQAAESNQNTASTENDAEDEADNVPSWASSQIRPKTGGGPQSLEEDMDFFEKELHRAHEDMMQERYVDALSSIEHLIQIYPDEPRLYLAKAITYDNYANQQQSNHLLMKAIEVYKQYLAFNATDDNLLAYNTTAERCVERMKSLGQFESALAVYERWINIFPLEPSIRNDLAVAYLMLDRLSDAKQVLENVLRLWPNNGFALVHYGFVLKQLDKDYHNAAIYLKKGIESKAPGTQVGRFYFQLGEALQRLGRHDEAGQIFRQGSDLKLYPSAYQRSLYNEPNLRAQPFWSLEKTSYGKYLSKLQANWLAIKAEGISAFSKSGYFLDESENLKNTGDWKEFELFSRGQQRRDNCLKAPITCNLINQFPAARDCKRGQVKFSVMQPGTHVWPHCGPTNCRLRAHLGLVVPNGTRLRVADKELSWEEGKFLIFDDSFEHEVWHEGDSLRLVLIVDVWHPDLTEHQRLSLTPI